MIEHTEVMRRIAASGGALPLLTIDEFFVGNTEEDSLAPNQLGYGRPSLEEMARRLIALAETPDVAWVRIQLHDDVNDGFDISASAVAICTSATTQEISNRLDVDSLRSDGVIDGFVYPITCFSDLPDIPENFKVLSLVWD